MTRHLVHDEHGLLSFGIVWHVGCRRQPSANAGRPPLNWIDVLRPAQAVLRLRSCVSTRFNMLGRKCWAMFSAILLRSASAIRCSFSNTASANGA